MYIDAPLSVALSAFKPSQKSSGRRVPYTKNAIGVELDLDGPCDILVVTLAAEADGRVLPPDRPLTEDARGTSCLRVIAAAAFKDVLLAALPDTELREEELPAGDFGGVFGGELGGVDNWPFPVGLELEAEASGGNLGDELDLSVALDADIDFEPAAGEPAGIAAALSSFAIGAIRGSLSNARNSETIFGKASPLFAWTCSIPALFGSAKSTSGSMRIIVAPLSCAVCTIRLGKPVVNCVPIISKTSHCFVASRAVLLL
eukprot:CAMPEP_0115527730 /NCGR_PEP_ID=MMETSP0271-20121206/83004_1 /TAXON_ID=71861 /ORGANISM="Scrippsiella trochoidea, Strain CCMP3099" /LENGTH=258 /DNA_ID=CAMNT_0002959585 /DNA_START=561 /DNA_END=1337 /DNA_ORIENTATION=-